MKTIASVSYPTPPLAAREAVGCRAARMKCLR